MVDVSVDQKLELQKKRLKLAYRRFKVRVRRDPVYAAFLVLWAVMIVVAVIALGTYAGSKNGKTAANTTATQTVATSSSASTASAADQSGAMAVDHLTARINTALGVVNSGSSSFSTSSPAAANSLVSQLLNNTYNYYATVPSGLNTSSNSNSPEVLGAATNTWTGNSANLSWSTAANWSLNRAPISTDDVVINGTNIAGHWPQLLNAVTISSFTLGTSTGSYLNILNNGASPTLNVSQDVVIGPYGVVTPLVTAIAGTSGDTRKADFIVNATGNITVQGYIDGVGAGGTNGNPGGPTGIGGGGHGGAGGAGIQVNNGATSGGGGAAFGSDITNPTAFGARGGGSSGNSHGGSGGGVIKLSSSSGTIDIDGTVSANGQDPFFAPGVIAAGGGSGGSVWLVAPTITGSGYVTAAGGSGSQNASGTIFYGGGGGGGRIAISPSGSAPSISSVTPNSGNNAGGDSVTISGSGFLPSSTVLFGGQSATSVSYVNSSTLVATVPASGSVGSVNVIVSNGMLFSGSLNVAGGAGGHNGNDGTISVGATATLTNGFTYFAQPTISSVSPTLVSIAGGSLTINGTNFASTSTVAINGVTVAKNFVSSFQLSATIPAATTGGPASVTVTNTGGATTTLNNAFTYVPLLGFQTSALSLAQNQEGSVTVFLKNNSGTATTSTQNLTVNLTTTSTGGQFSLAASPSWSAISSVTIPAGSSTATFYYRDSVKASPTITIQQASLTSITATQAETITTKYRLKVTGISNPVQAGVPSSVTVQSVDFAGNPLTDYVGQIHFTSTDTFASMPANFTFTSGMLGIHTFVNGVTMGTQGTWNVTATDVSDSNITGSQTGIVVTAPNAGTISKLVIITQPQSFATTGHSSAITIQTQDVNGTVIPVASATTIRVTRTTTTGTFSLDGETSYANPGAVGNFYTFTIPAHASSASVYYKDTTAGTPTLTFTAASFGWTAASQQETVGAGPASKYLLSVSGTVHANTWSALTATLSDSNSVPVTSLEGTDAYFSKTSGTAKFSTSPSGANPVNSLYAPILAGNSSVTIYFMDTVYHTTPVTVSDSTPANGNTGLIDATLNVNVSPAFDRLVFSAGPSSVAKTVASTAYTVQAQDSVGNVVTMSSDFTVYPYSTAGTGGFDTSSGGAFTTTSLTIPNGSSSVSFYYKDSAIGTPTLTVSDHTPLDSPDIDIINATKNITVTDSPPTKLVYTTAPQTIATGTASGIITIQAQHADNSPAILATSATVNLSSSLTSGHTGTVVKFMATANVNATAITTVTILAGSSSASFYFTDNGYGGRNISAVYTGLPTATQALTVQSGAPTQMVFTSTPQTVQADYVSGQFTVAFEDSLGNLSALTAGKTISLSSSCGTGDFSAAAPPSWASVSALSLPSGTQTFSFYYLDSAGGTCTLLASGSGLASGSQSVTILPPPIKLAFTQGPQTIIRGQSAASLIIGLEDVNGNLAPRPTATTVYLTSTSGTGVFSHTSIIIPANRLTGSVTYIDTVIGTATLTAADQNGGPDTGLIDGTTTFTVAYGPVRSFVLAPAQATQQNGNLNQFTLTFKNQYGYAAPADQDLPVVLSSQLNTGSFYDAAGTTNLGANPTITVTSGSNSAVFWYGGAAQTTNITATDSSMSATSRVTVVPDNAYKLVILSAGGISFTAGQTAAMSVAVEDVFGDYVPVTSDLTVYLATDSGTGTIPSSITILSGAYSANFNYLDTGAGNFNLTASDYPLPQASDLGLVNGTLAVTYDAGVGTKVGLHPVDSSPYINDRVQVNVSIDNSFNTPVTVGADTTVALTTSAGTGHYYDGVGSATVITSVVIPNGQSSVPVWYSQTVGGSTTLTGVSTGYTTGHAVLNVVSTSARSLSVSSSPASIVTGQTSTVTVTLRDSGGVATTEATGRNVYLSTDSTTAVFPTTAVIPANTSSVTVSFSDTTAGVWNITAGDHALPESPDLGLTNGAAQITVGNGVASQLGWENVPTQFERGQVVQLRLALQNPYGGEVVAASGFTAYFKSSATPGQFAADPNGTWGITSLTFPAGVSSIPVYYRDFTTVNTIQLTASDVSSPPEVPDTGLTNAVTSIAEIYGDAAQLAWINPPATLPVTHTSSLFQVELRNADGQPTPSQGGTAIYLDGGGPVGNQFSQNGINGWGVTSFSIGSGNTRGNIYFRSQTEGVATITASDKAQINPDTGMTNAVATINITRQVLDHLLVTNISTPQNQGTPTSVVVVAEDAENYPVSWYDGTVHFTSDDPSYTTLPADYTFVPTTDLGTHTFTNGVIFARPGTKAVTATDSGNSISGTQSGIIVNGASGNPVAKLAFVAPPTQPLTVAQYAASDVITLEAQDINSQPTVAPVGGLAVHLTSNGSGGRFSATPGGTYSATLDLAIGAGISAVNLYYKDSNAGSFVITGRDWNGGIDSSSIDNATLNVTVTAAAGPSIAPAPGVEQTGRKVTLSSSHIGDPDLAFQWHSGLSTTVKAIRFMVCNDPTNTVACVKPTGSDMTATTLVSTGGELGSGWTFTVLADNEVLLTKASGAAVTAGTIQTVNLTGFVNPTSIGTFFFRVVTYSTTAAVPGDILDYGAVAASTARTLTPTVDVAEALVFRVANAVAADCSSQTDVADPNDAASDLVVLSPQTMTMTTTSIGSAQMCATTNAGNGFVISYFDAALGGATKGFYNGAHEFAVANQFTSTIGSEQFGFNLRANTVPSQGFDPDGNGLVADLINPDYATVNKYSYNDTGLFVALASKTAPNSASARYSLSYVANISPTTSGGTYKAHQIFVITATF